MEDLINYLESHTLRGKITHDELIKLGYIYANENGQKYYWHHDSYSGDVQLRQDDDGEWLLWSEQDHVETLISKVPIKSIGDLRVLHLILFGTEI